MEKGGCICCVISTILAIIGIVVLILYFTLGSGDNGGNNINIDGKGGKGGKGGNGDNNIIQKTVQGGIHILDCTGNLHVNWKALMAVGFIVLAILLSKWAIQHNWCRVFKVCRKGSKTKNDKRTKGGNSDIEMQHWGKSGRQFHNDRQDIIETHMPRLNDRQTVYSKQTADPQTADIQLAPQTAVLPLQAANLESRLREGSIYFNFFKNLKQMGFRSSAYDLRDDEKLP